MDKLSIKDILKLYPPRPEVINDSVVPNYLTNLQKSSLLDSGALPVEELAYLARREGRHPRPIYQTHRWFARRFSSVFRALLIASDTTNEKDFWNNYYRGTNWEGRVLLDPFVGGGTSVIEASRLGATTLGIDIDAVACAITRFESKLGLLPDLNLIIEELQTQIGTRISPYYQTVTENGELQQVLHYFWVQVVKCNSCNFEIEAHPHYQIAYDAEGTKQWVFCPNCHSIYELDRSESIIKCSKCNIFTPLSPGPNNHGKLKCPSCGKEERIIDSTSRSGKSHRGNYLL